MFSGFIFFNEIMFCIFFLFKEILLLNFKSLQFEHPSSYVSSSGRVQSPSLASTLCLRGEDPGEGRGAMKSLGWGAEDGMTWVELRED